MPRSVEALTTSLSLPSWWPSVTNHTAHIMLVGETQSGKSTTAYALLYERAKTDKIIIIDPHEQKNDWPLAAANHGRNYDEIEQLFQIIHREFERRYMPNEPSGEPITVFIDELPSIVAMKKPLMDLVKQWLREAAKIKIRLVILSQDANVKTLGIDGEGPVRENLMKILLGSFAADVPHVDNYRPAAIERRGKVTAISLDGIRIIAQQKVYTSSLWTLPKVSSKKPSISTEYIVPVQENMSEFAGIPPVTSDDTTDVPSDGLTDEVIKTLHISGWSMNKIAALMLRGNKQQRLARIRSAIEVVEHTV